MSSIQRICSIEECNRVVCTRGWCKQHYAKWVRYGNPNKPTKVGERHGLSFTSIHIAWVNIKNRCLNDTNKAYPKYGGRGITICEGWKNSLKSFYEDMGEKPAPNYTIDRIDGDGNYSCGKCSQCISNNWPMNCRWADRYIQNWNRNKQERNTSGFIGVSRNHTKWQAEMGYKENGKRQRFYLGTYDTPEEAAIAYDKAVIFFRGQYAITNLL